MYLIIFNQFKVKFGFNIYQNKYNLIDRYLNQIQKILEYKMNRHFSLQINQIILKIF